MAFSLRRFMLCYLTKAMQMEGMHFPFLMADLEGTNWQEVLGVPIINHDICFGGSVYLSVSGSHLDQEGIIGGNKSGFFKVQHEYP
jgi:hypothetical protein